MSGGSLNYVYSRVEEAAAEVRHRAQNLEQSAFASHLFKVAKALKDLEWHYSSDTEDPVPVSMMQVISPADVVGAAKKEAERLIKELERYAK